MPSIRLIYNLKKASSAYSHWVSRLPAGRSGRACGVCRAGWRGALSGWRRGDACAWLWGRSLAGRGTEQVGGLHRLSEQRTKMNFYLENIQNWLTFAAESKTCIRMATTLCFPIILPARATRLSLPRGVMHVHWFSGFI